ncbi:MAG TPA: mercury methylation corrinoid protein HgcA [Methanoregulaceae archaeon]|nr:mercury methylation corrinoid protein HgcA [Methanoregulaceae archaeon]
MSESEGTTNYNDAPCGCGCESTCAAEADKAAGVGNSGIKTVSPVLDRKASHDHVLARLGQNRNGHRVAPGLYSLGWPGPSSPVIVTANYTLSFDAVRSGLGGIDAFILVLDTKGINVWCAAGKGTFGTSELVNRIHLTGLASVVHHRRLILPQLGAPGVSAHNVHRATGFHVEYGPVRARDLPRFLVDRVATPEMRTVQFTTRDRIVLIPVELRSALIPTIIGAIALWLVGGWLAASALIASIIAGTVVFPILLPYLPTVDFSTKGLFLGFIVAIPFAIMAFISGVPIAPLWVSITSMISLLLVIPALTAYLALNFTGSTPYTSRTGVRKEIFSYIPVMTGAGLIGLTFALVVGLTHFMGVW